MQKSLLGRTTASVLAVAALFCIISAGAQAQPPLGSQLDLRPQGGGIPEETRAQSAYSVDKGTILVIYERSSALLANQGEVRGRLIRAGGNGLALSTIADDVLLIQQANPGGTSSNQINSIRIAYNPFSKEFIVAAGGQIDADNVDNVADVGQVFARRVNASTGQPVGSLVTLQAGASNTANSILQGSEVSIGTSSATGNILLTFGVSPGGLANQGTLGAALFSSTLTRLDTTGARYHTAYTEIGAPTAFPTPAPTPAYIMSVVQGGGSIVFATGVGFIASYNELYANVTPLNILVGEVSRSQNKTTVVDDAAPGGVLTSSTPSAIVSADFGADNFLSVDDFGNTAPLPATGVSRATVNNARVVKNPDPAPAANAQYVMAYTDGELSAFSELLRGLRLQYFGLGAGPAFAPVIGPNVVLIDRQLPSAGLGSNTAAGPGFQFRLTSSPDIIATSEFAPNQLLIQVGSDVENGNPLGQVGRANRVQYFLTSSAGAFATGFSLNNPIKLREITTVGDWFSGSDRSALVNATGKGYVLAVWAERTSDTAPNNRRHAAARAIGAVPPEAPFTIASETWESVTPNPQNYPGAGLVVGSDFNFVGTSSVPASSIPAVSSAQFRTVSGGVRYQRVTTPALGSLFPFGHSLFSAISPNLDDDTVTSVTISFRAFIGALTATSAATGDGFATMTVSVGNSGSTADVFGSGASLTVQINNQIQAMPITGFIGPTVIPASASRLRVAVNDADFGFLSLLGVELALGSPLNAYIYPLQGQAPLALGTGLSLAPAAGVGQGGTYLVSVQFKKVSFRRTDITYSMTSVGAPGTGLGPFTGTSTIPASFPFNKKMDRLALNLGSTLGYGDGVLTGVPNTAPAAGDAGLEGSWIDDITVTTFGSVPVPVLAADQWEVFE